MSLMFKAWFTLLRPAVRIALLYSSKSNEGNVVNTESTIPAQWTNLRACGSHHHNIVTFQTG